MKSLQIARQEIGELWSDETHRQFEENFLVPLEPGVRRTLTAIDKLAEVLSRAQRDCEDY